MKQSSEKSCIKSLVGSIKQQSKMTKHTIFILLIILANTIQNCLCSGIFEINLAALTDSYGRDLRLDCCAWQNLSQQQTTITAGQQVANQQSLMFHQNHLHSSNQQQQQQQQQSCDPTKCQLIIRICVKNYQTQIDPSQCTFGELSAQVMKPNEPMSQHYNQILASSSSLSSSSLARLHQQQQLAALNKLRGSQQQQQVANIHHQRMLLQQLQMQQTGANLANLGQTHEQHARLYHQALNGPILSSGQPRAMRQIAFDQPISFPFNFTWPGAFSLIVDAWYESPTGLQQVAGVPVFSAHLAPVARHHHHQQQQHQHNHNKHHSASPPPLPTTTTYDLYKKQLIIQHSMHGWLTVKNEWTSGVHKTDSATLVYSYRVTCQPNYYGEQCNILCRSRDDVYGHFTCSQQGEVMCLPGWQGQYCEEPICLQGCHRDQGNCTRPNECNCRFGWQGTSCEQCVRYPGCVHGTCTKPHECICEEGWGGLLCNEDLNYCNNHQPCKNGALCTNTFDARGEGSYVCTCEEGFAGKNCEKRIMGANARHSKQATSIDQTTRDPMILTNSLSNLTQTAGGGQQQQAPPASRSLQGGQGSAARNVAPSRGQATATTAAAATTTAQNTMPPLSSYHFGQQAQATTVQAANLDHRVIIAYGIIIVCMVILAVLAVLRVFFARLSGAVASNGANEPATATSNRHHRHSHRSSQSRSRSRSRSAGAAGRVSSSRRHTSRSGALYYACNQSDLRSVSNNGADVAAMQNQQNIYKSRTSLSTDKVPFNCLTDSLDSADSALDTCSSSASSLSSGSSASSLMMMTTTPEHYLTHQNSDDYHRSLAAGYGVGPLRVGAASANRPAGAGHYSASASLHYGPTVGARYLAGSAAQAGAAHYAHYGPHAHYAPLATARSVHNISSTYQQLLRAAASTNNVPADHHHQPVPPPPPYSAQHQQQHSHPSSIYNCPSTLYGAVPGLMAAGLHHAPSSTIYTNASNYGTAATLANQAVSAGLSAPSASATSSASQQLTESNNKTTKTSPNKQSKATNNSAQDNNQVGSTASTSSSTTTTTTTTTMPNNNNNNKSEQQTETNPYGNIQQQETPTNNQQQQCYVILCNHNNHNFQSS